MTKVSEESNNQTVANNDASKLATDYTQENLPDPAGLLAALKAIGYSIGEALSDLIDNSIDANASNVVLEFGRDDKDLLFIRVIDDGEGIAPNHIEQAMKFGGKSKKGKESLGCFGMGMKTASFAIADSLTVVSHTKKDKSVGRRWTAKNIRLGWVEDILKDEAAEQWINMDYGEINISKQGTVVQLDNIQDFNVASGQVSTTLDRIHKELRFHIGLHFHRLLEKNRINIFISTINIQSELSTGYEEILPINPMPEISGNKNYPKDFTFDLNNEQMNIKTYVWPKNSKSIGYAMGGRAPDHQGFYWYRNDRLIDIGWSKLRATDPHMNLARASIDLSPELDEIFGLQVGKYKIDPPRIFLNDVVNKSLSKDGLPLNTWMNEAEATYRAKPKTEPKITCVYPSDGFGDKEKKKIYMEIFSRGEENEEKVICKWDNFDDDELLFEIDHEDFEITINESIQSVKKMDKASKEYLALTIFLSVKEYFLITSFQSKHEEAILEINTALLESLK